MTVCVPGSMSSVIRTRIGPAIDVGRDVRAALMLGQRQPRRIPAVGVLAARRVDRDCPGSRRVRGPDRARAGPRETCRPSRRSESSVLPPVNCPVPEEERTRKMYEDKTGHGNPCSGPYTSGCRTGPLLTLLAISNATHHPTTHATNDHDGNENPQHEGRRALQHGEKHDERKQKQRCIEKCCPDPEQQALRPAPWLFAKPQPHSGAWHGLSPRLQANRHVAAHNHCERKVDDRHEEILRRRVDITCHDSTKTFEDGHRAEVRRRMRNPQSTSRRHVQKEPLPSASRLPDACAFGVGGQAP